MRDGNLDVQRFVSKSSKSIIFYIVSIMITLYAVIWLQYFIFGSIALGGMLFVAFNSAIEIDFKRLRYRNVKYLAALSFGKWVDLPEIKYVSVFRVKIVSGVRGLSNTRISSNEKAIQVNLIHGKNQRLKVYQTIDTEDAFEKARLIAGRMGLDVYDATKREGKWLD